MGYLYLRPLSSLKMGDVKPFIIIEKYVVEIQLIIHMTKECENPI
jgi:hypothetical protein